MKDLLKDLQYHLLITAILLHPKPKCQNCCLVYCQFHNYVYSLRWKILDHKYQR